MIIKYKCKYEACCLFTVDWRFFCDLHFKLHPVKSETGTYANCSWNLKKSLKKDIKNLVSRPLAKCFKFKFTFWNVMQKVFDKSLLLLKTIICKCIGRVVPL